jgi:hypothetical protein
VLSLCSMQCRKVVHDRRITTPSFATDTHVAATNTYTPRLMLHPVCCLLLVPVSSHDCHMGWDTRVGGKGCGANQHQHPTAQHTGTQHSMESSDTGCCQQTWGMAAARTQRPKQGWQRQVLIRLCTSYWGAATAANKRDPSTSPQPHCPPPTLASSTFARSTVTPSPAPPAAAWGCTPACCCDLHTELPSCNRTCSQLSAGQHRAVGPVVVAVATDLAQHATLTLLHPLDLLTATHTHTPAENQLQP